MPKQIAIARALRKRLTPQEVKVWVKLRELRPLGFHFRRQVPIGPYIVDFACKRTGLIVEIDGGQHGLEAGAKRDSVRDKFLEAQGFYVRRFWNSDVDRNLQGVIESIVLAAQEPHPARKRAPPSPVGGGIRAAADPSPERGGWPAEGRSGGVFGAPERIAGDAV